MTLTAASGPTVRSASVPIPVPGPPAPALLFMLAFIFVLGRRGPEIRVVRGQGCDLTRVEGRVEEHLERTEWLSPPLWLHAEQHDPSVPVFHVQRRRVPLHMLLSEEIS